MNTFGKLKKFFSWMRIVIFGILDLFLGIFRVDLGWENKIIL